MVTHRQAIKETKMLKIKIFSIADQAYDLEACIEICLLKTKKPDEIF